MMGMVATTSDRTETMLYSFIFESHFCPDLMHRGIYAKTHKFMDI